MWTIWKRRLAIAAGVAAGLAAIGVGAYFLIDAIRDDGDEAASPPAPRIVVHTERPQPEAAEDLGFPEFATKNTTRVAGTDVAANAAAVALAVYPSTGGVPGPDAVSLVDSRDWQSGIAAAGLVGPPVGAPILISDGEELPDLTAAALDALGPGGSAATKGAQVFQIGDATAPSGLDTQRVDGKSAAAIAAEVDKLRQRLTGEQPANILLVGSQQPEYAMPAAGWAARSGEPVLFVGRDSVPEPTLDALKRHKDASLYALGPPSAISDKVLKEVKDAASRVVRIGDSDPVRNAIDFARHVDGNFGWNVTDPGHGLVIASDREPLDAAAAAPLSASGNWGPLLVTDDPRRVPESLRGYLLDIKPGYVDDPTRAVYNHAWIIGDQQTISVGFQAQVDDLAEVAPVRSGVQPPSQKPKQPGRSQGAQDSKKKKEPPKQ